MGEIGCNMNSNSALLVFACVFAAVAVEVDGGMCSIGCDKEGNPCDCPAACWNCLVSTAKGQLSTLNEAKLKAFSNKMKAAFLAGTCSACKFPKNAKCTADMAVDGISCGIKNLKKLLQGKGQPGGKPVPIDTYLKDSARY